MVKANSALALQTLRSVLSLDAKATFADLLRHCEALAKDAAAARGAQGRSQPQGLATETPSPPESAGAEERIAAQDQRIAELTAHCESLQQQLEVHQGIAAKQTRLAAEQTAQLAELQEQLACQENSNARLQVELDELRSNGDERLAEADARRAEDRVELDRQLEENRELNEALERQGDLVDRLSAQLQVHEAADRRRFSYRPDSKVMRMSSTGLEEEMSFGGLGSEQGSVGSALNSGRGGGPSYGDFEDSDLPTPTLSRGSTQMSTPRMASKAAQLSGMTEEERVKFLAHFPMASRTERHLRNRIEERTRLKPPPKVSGR